MLRRWCSRYLNAITLSIHAGFLLAFLFEFDVAGREVWQLFLFVSLLAWRREAREEGTEAIREGSVYLTAAILTVLGLN